MTSNSQLEGGGCYCRKIKIKQEHWTKSQKKEVLPVSLTVFLVM